MGNKKRIEDLEEKFKDPRLELHDTGFEEWVQHQGAIGANRSLNSFKKDFYTLLDYLKLEVVTIPEHKVMKKRPTPSRSLPKTEWDKLMDELGWSRSKAPTVILPPIKPTKKKDK